MPKPWFAPKQYGYGASLPISWEGWAVLICFFAGIFVSRIAISAYAPAEYAFTLWFAPLGALIIALILIARAHTEGGWRWRNGRGT